MITKLEIKISLILPAHNEEKNIAILVPKILKEYKNFLNEIIIVNDNSTDQTKEVALQLIKKYGNKIKLINRKPPNGVGYAIRDGIQNVSKESNWILSMDADFIDNVGDIKRLIEKAGEGYDGVIGSRYLNRHSLVKYPFTKKFANRIYHLLLRLVFNLELKDITNNFKLYKKEVFGNMKITSSDFAVNAETGLIPIVKGYKIAEVPVIWKQRSHGKSNFIVLKLAPSYLKVFYKVLNEKK